MQRRHSDRRALILNCICGSKEHPNAEMIFQQLRQDNPSLSRGTVYRNLNVLVEEGAIIRLPGEVERYDGRVDGHPHLLCKCCGNVSDLDFCTDPAEMNRRAEERCGVRVDRHDLIFYGTCARCVSAEAAEK